MDRPLTRAERNRRAMNGVPMDAPRSLIRKSSERKPLIDLEAADEAAELERARKAQLAGSTPEAAEARRRQAILAEKERSRAEHEAQEASAPPKPKPAKAKPRG